MAKENKTGFTLIEIIIVIAILGSLSAVIVSGFISFNKNSILNNSSEEFISALKLAQSKSMSSEDYSSYGVYINPVDLTQYILFKGSSYAGRVPSFDQVYSLENNVEFNSVILYKGGVGFPENASNEIVFDRLTGFPKQWGSITVRNKADIESKKTILVTSSGEVNVMGALLNEAKGEASLTVLDDGRIKDSWHIQFEYLKMISPNAGASLILSFDNDGDRIYEAGETTKQIFIGSPYINETTHELQYEDTISVVANGQEYDQKIGITTQFLGQNPVVYNIYRDRRYNNIGFKISIVDFAWFDDVVVEYSADGKEVTSKSSYAVNFKWL